MLYEANSGLAHSVRVSSRYDGAGRTIGSRTTGKHVLIFTLSVPRQLGDATPENNEPYPASGLLFRLLVNSAIQRDLGWLAIEFGAS